MRAGDDDVMQPGVVVGGRAEQRDGAAWVEVAAVVGGVDRAPGDDEAQPAVIEELRWEDSPTASGIDDMSPAASLPFSWIVRAFPAIGLLLAPRLKRS